MNAITKHEGGALAIPENEAIQVLRASLYPGAEVESVKLVLSYCRAAGLDPMQKPVHIVPMWDRNSGSMRNVIMPGIGLYRTQAARSGEYAGMSEPEFGPDVTEMVGEVQMTYPAWCKVAVMRRLPTGEIVAFPAKEFWRENYAVKGGKEKSIAPNAMWLKRPYGQIAKCAEAQALRKAFPEIGSQPTAEEMEGRTMGPEPDPIAPPAAVVIPEPRRVELQETLELCDTMERLAEVWKSMTKDERKAMEADKEAAKTRILAAEGEGPAE